MVERRIRAPLRVPFVRRCSIRVEAGREEPALLVNINAIGVYVARDTMPGVGQIVRCRFSVPGSVREVQVEGVVAWTNPVQAHPIHSLPPGFGVSFRDVPEEAQRVIERIIREHIARRHWGRV